MFDLIRSIWPEDQHVEAIGVAAPGPINPYTGVIAEAPNIPGWINLPLRQYTQERFKVPVVVGNDANLAALAEWKHGVGRGHHHLVETVRTYQGLAFPGTLDIRERDEVEVVEPFDHMYHGDRFRVIGVRYADHNPRDPRNYLLIQMTRSVRAHNQQ